MTPGHIRAADVELGSQPERRLNDCSLQIWFQELPLLVVHHTISSLMLQVFPLFRGTACYQFVKLVMVCVHYMDYVEGCMRNLGLSGPRVYWGNVAYPALTGDHERPRCGVSHHTSRDCNVQQESVTDTTGRTCPGVAIEIDTVNTNKYLKH